MDTGSQSDTKQSLMEQILSKDNLKAAYLQGVRNKGAAGVDGMNVEELGDYLSENGVKLIELPCTERYARWCERSAGEIIACLLLD